MTWMFLSIVLYIYVMCLCCFVTNFFTFVLDAVKQCDGAYESELELYIYFCCTSVCCVRDFLI